MIRDFTIFEEENFNFITSLFPEASSLILTATGLSKSIMDATLTLRANLKLSKIHDYDTQLKGPEGKIIVKSVIWDNHVGFVETEASLYRPETKDGDPRIWIYGLKEYALENVALAIIPFRKKIYVINLATFNISMASAEEFFTSANSIANELLNRMRLISREWIPGIRHGDCSVGDTLEQALGIKQNSSKNPDYKGIEIKSKRSGSKTREGLFAQVPNWEISNLKSSKEILDYYGYVDALTQIRRLYVTVTALKPNPQGLKLVVNYKTKTLDEVFVREDKIYPVAKWDIETLLERLVGKHKETFWIKAESVKTPDAEFLLYYSIEHTKKPIVENFLKLIESGDITMDHLIKEKGKSAVEKGPIFKLKPNSFAKLFPEPVSYELIEKDLLKSRICEIKKLIAS